MQVSNAEWNGKGTQWFLCDLWFTHIWIQLLKLTFCPQCSLPYSSGHAPDSSIFIFRTFFHLPALDTRSVLLNLAELHSTYFGPNSALFIFVWVFNKVLTRSISLVFSQSNVRAFLKFLVSRPLLKCYKIKTPLATTHSPHNSSWRTTICCVFCPCSL